MKDRDAEGRCALFPEWILCTCSHHLLCHTACTAWEALRMWSRVTNMNLDFQNRFCLFPHFMGIKKQTTNKRERLHMYLGEFSALVLVL